MKNLRPFLPLLPALLTVLHAQPATPGPTAVPAPAANPERRSPPQLRDGQPPRPRPDFWSQQFNSTTVFKDLGIATLAHGSLVSKKLRYKDQVETEVGYVVYLPPEYEKSPARYPVLYFLHGLGGNENTVAPVVQAADRLIRDGQLPPFIIVAPAGGRAFYGNHFAGRLQYHDFFMEELLPHIDATYRTLAGRGHRHIQGFSMGGYGAAMFAVKHPEAFGAFTEIGGALLGPRFNVWPDMYDSNEEHFAPFDLLQLTEANRDALQQMRIAQWIGSEDSTKNANVQYHELLARLGLVHEFNDWHARPQLAGVPHNLPRYYEQHALEILKFHTDAFAAAQPPQHGSAPTKP